MKNKLRSRRGETITETLVAVLLIMLTSAAFAAMVSAASHVNAKAEAQDNALFAALAETVGRESSPVSGTVTVSGLGEDIEFSVDYYSDSAENLSVYE